MKVRMDFVTNSSSSSFLIAFKDKIEGIEKINSISDYYGDIYVDTLCHDFIAADPIPSDELESKICDEFEDVIFYETQDRFDDRGCPRVTFQDKWLADHPDKTWRDYYNSEELKAEEDRIIKEQLSKVKKEIGDRGYLVMLEYEDHDRIGGELEHEILPECDFVVRRFSHH